MTLSLTSSRFHLILVMGLSLFLFFFRLGDRPLRNPDEGRYAEVAREMVVSGNWVEPRLYGVDYLRKPALFYWLLAASFSLAGFSELAARCVPALFGIAGVLATYIFARRFFDEKTGFYASLVLATNFWYLQVGRFLLIDVVFSFFVTAGLFLFYAATERSHGKNILFSLAYICISSAFLAKGLAGMLLPVLTIVAYLALLKKIGYFFSVKQIFLFALIFLVLALPWYVKIAIQEPEFLRFFFWHEHFARYTSSNFEHQESWYYYLLVTPIAFVPWVFVYEPWKIIVTDTLRGMYKKPAIFLAVASACILLFYSLSRTKLPTYILPVIPFVSVLIGHGWSVWESKGAGAFSKSFTTPLLLLFFFMGCVVALTPESLIQQFFKRSRPNVIHLVQYLAVAAATGGLVALRSLRARNVQKVFFAMTLMMAIMSGVIVYAMEAINTAYTTKHFAEKLRPVLGHQDTVYLYDHPGVFYDFGFYLDRPVKLVGLEGELKHSDESTDTAGWHEKDERDAWVSREFFFEKIRMRERLFCLIRKSDFHDLPAAVKSSLNILLQDERKILFEVAS